MAHFGLGGKLVLVAARAVDLVAAGVVDFVVELVAAGGDESGKETAAAAAADDDDAAAADGLALAAKDS
jgi:hypothetical protein